MGDEAAEATLTPSGWGHHSPVATSAGTAGVRLGVTGSPRSYRL